MDLPTSPKDLVSSSKKGDYQTIQSFIDLPTSPKDLVSSSKKGFYKLFRALQICLHHQRIWCRRQRRDLINYLEFYRSSYHCKSVVSPTKKVAYKLFRALWICLHHQRVWYRRQRRRLINYLQRYRSANITKCFGIVVKEGGLSTIQSFIDLPTSPKVFLSSSKKGVYKLFRALQICLPMKGFGNACKEGVL